MTVHPEGSKCVDTAKARVCLIGERIIRIMVHEGAELDEADILEMHRIDQALAQGGRYALLIDSGTDTSITPAARALTASPALSTNRIAKAIIVNNLAQRIIGNAYISFHRPITPTRIFTSTQQALEWLREIVQSSNLLS